MKGHLWLGIPKGLRPAISCLKRGARSGNACDLHEDFGSKFPYK